MFGPMKNSIRHFFTKPCVKVISAGLGLCLIVLSMVWARAFYGSMRNYQQGDAYFKKAQYIRAITFFDRSMHWYTPRNPYVRQSAERLWEIGLRAKQQGDTRLALIAIRTIRRGFYAARSFHRPGKDWIKKCDAKINEFMRAKPKTPKDSSVQHKSETPASLGATDPSILWTLVVEIGFLGWIAAAIGFIMFALKDSRKAKFSTSKAIVWAAISLTFFVVWLVGMMKA